MASQYLFVSPANHRNLPSAHEQSYDGRIVVVMATCTRSAWLQLFGKEHEEGTVRETASNSATKSLIQSPNNKNSYI